jgi:hypothetical protein
MAEHVNKTTNQLWSLPSNVERLVISASRVSTSAILLPSTGFSNSRPILTQFYNEERLAHWAGRRMTICRETSLLVETILIGLFVI